MLPRTPRHAGLAAKATPPPPPPTSPKSPETDDEGYPGRETLRSLKDGLFVVQDVVTQGLFGLVACGLLLNVCGIGYNISPREGVVIKPQSEMRQEGEQRRFTRAAKQLFRPDPAPPADAALRLRGGGGGGGLGKGKGKGLMAPP